MTDRRIEYLPLDALRADPRNPKRHSDEIAKSIDRFGYIEPVVVDERTGFLISGHGRVEQLAVLKKAGTGVPDGVHVAESGEWEVPTVRGWASKDDIEASAALIGVNALTAAGGWMDADLAPLLEQIAATPLGLEGIGYTNDDLAELLVHVGAYDRQPPGDVDPDDVPEPPAEPVTQRGGVWLCGPHRLMCGDATSEADHDTALGPYAQVDLCLTDPPYGIGVDYGDHMEDTPKAIVELIGRFMPLVLRYPRALITSGHRCMWDYPRPDWLLAWVHPAGSGANSWGFTCMNPVLAYGRDPFLAAGLGRRPDTLVLATDREGVDGHPVVKPINVWRWLVERGTTAEGQTVLDPFCGAGTTIVACELTGRIGIGIELAPRFCDVSLARWQRLTGELPILEATGETHDFLAELAVTPS